MTAGSKCWDVLTVMLGQDQQLRQAFEGYSRRHPEHEGGAREFMTLLDEGGVDPFTRERLAGHFTGSAWLVSADGRRALLTHHRKLQRWLQLGGHADGDVDLAGVALREAQEETGVAGLRLEDGAIFDLDRHWIPVRGQVPGHWHYDVRYLVRAGVDERFVVSAGTGLRLVTACTGVHRPGTLSDRRHKQRLLASKQCAILPPLPQPKELPCPSSRRHLCL